MEVGDTCCNLAIILHWVHIHSSVWRISVGLSLVPAFGTLYQRLTLPESKRYEEAKRMNADTDYMKEQVAIGTTPLASEEDVDESQLHKKAHFRGNERCLIHITDD